MNKVFFSLLTGLMLSSQVSAECSYTLDVTQAQIDANNVAGGRESKLFPIINLVDQKGVGLVEYQYYVAPDQIATSKAAMNNMVNIDIPIKDKKILGTNIIATEIVFDVSDLQNINLGNSSELLQLTTGILSSSTIKNELDINLGYSLINNYDGFNDGGQLTILAASTKLNAGGNTVMKDVDRKVHNINPPANGKVVLGIYINQVSKQIGYIVNGINYGYLNINFENPLKDIIFNLALQQGTNPTSKFLGKKPSIQLITDKAKLTQTYPSGTTDICGMPI